MLEQQEQIDHGPSKQRWWARLVRPLFTLQTQPANWVNPSARNLIIALEQYTYAHMHLQYPEANIKHD